MIVPTYKPVHIGSESLPQDYAASLMRAKFGGIDVITDSREMQKLLDTCSSLGEQELALNGIARFTYLTGGKLPFRTADDKDLQQLTRTYPGDIYMSPDMSEFSFYGVDKIGTLLSMCYGIRALHTITDGELGLHSALVRDSYDETGILLVGKNRSGKSSIGFGIEESTTRYDLIADDWSEVSISTGTARALSPVFSSETPSDVYRPAFDSFGKRFYSKQRAAAGSLPLKAIVEIHTSTSETDDRFLSNSLAHIPLMCQSRESIRSLATTTTDDTTIEAAISRVRAITDGYATLRKKTDTYAILNEQSHNTLSEAIQKVTSLIG